jgi:hypothetical protein
MPNKKKQPKGTVKLVWTRSHISYVPYKNFAWIGGVLTLLYIFGLPLSDLDYKLLNPAGHAIGDNFYNSVFFISYAPLVIFALIWAYGLYGVAKTHQRNISRFAAFAFALAVVLLSGGAYFWLTDAFSFLYRFPGI